MKVGKFKKRLLGPQILGINCLAGSFSMSSLAQRLAALLRRQKCRCSIPREKQGVLEEWWCQFGHLHEPLKPWVAICPLSKAPPVVISREKWERCKSLMGIKASNCTAFQYFWEHFSFGSKPNEEGLSHNTPFSIRTLWDPDWLLVYVAVKLYSGRSSKCLWIDPDSGIGKIHDVNCVNIKQRRIKTSHKKYKV